jgi:hypothetical protein
MRRHLFHSCRVRQRPGRLPGESSSDCHSSGLEIEAYALAVGKCRELRLESSHLPPGTYFPAVRRLRNCVTLSNISGKHKWLRTPEERAAPGHAPSGWQILQGIRLGSRPRPKRPSVQIRPIGRVLSRRGGESGHRAVAAHSLSERPRSGIAGAAAPSRTYLSRITRRYAATFLLCSSRSWAKR